MTESVIEEAKSIVNTMSTKIAETREYYQSLMNVYNNDNDFQLFVNGTNKGKSINLQLQSISSELQSICNQIDELGSKISKYLTLIEENNN